MGQQAVNGSNSVIQHMTKTYTTFSGVDITALFDNMTVMTLQGVAVSITREKVPVYVFGRARPVSVSRGKRGVAGTLQFVLFDRDALYNVMVDADHQYYAHADEVNWLLNTQTAPAWQNGVAANAQSLGTAIGTTQLNQTSPVNTISQGSTAQELAFGQTTVTTGAARSIRTTPQYADQIWPFDVTLVAQNEYGQGAWSSIIGVEIINEGGGISMDDLTNEEQCTYIAIHRHPWTNIERDIDTNTTDYWAGNALLNNQGRIFAPGGVISSGT